MGRPTVFDIYEDVGYTGYILRVTYADGSEVFGRTACASSADPVLAADGNLYQIEYTWGAGLFAVDLMRYATSWGGSDPQPAVSVCAATVSGPEPGGLVRVGAIAVGWGDSVVGLFQASAADVVVMRPNIAAAPLAGSAVPFYDSALMWVGSNSVGITEVGDPI